MATDSQWNRIYDKVSEVKSEVANTNIEMGRIAQQMADHVESDTKCFQTLENGIKELSDKFDTFKDLALTKEDAQRESRKNGVIVSAIVSIFVSFVAACASLVADK